MQIGVIGLGRMGSNITFAEKILSAMRKGSGAHVESKDRKAKPS